MFTVFKRIKEKILDWCVSSYTISVKDLHTLTTPRDCEIYDNNDLKFIEQTTLERVFVKTPTGFSRIKYSHKTVPYEVFQLNLEHQSLTCADHHIVITSNGQQKRVIDLVPFQDKVQTKYGDEYVRSVKCLSKFEPMYDLELDDKNHVYYTNNILSHNSVISAVYLLWYAMFNPDKTILIVSNKNSGAMEMIYRIQYAYEELPNWLKPGVTDSGWNKHEVAFDNGSRIISEATSEDSGRGKSISLLYCDELAFVPANIQDAFWTSISPTLATGGSCILTSTPNGDSNLFAQIWRTANAGIIVGEEEQNIAFQPLQVRWDEPPGRDEKFKQQQIAIIGELKWKQEYECLTSDNLVEILDDKGIIRVISLEQLYYELMNAQSN